MIKNGELDEIMASDIYAKDDPAVLFQRFLSRKCVELKYGMTEVGATFSLIQIRHDFTTKKITVNVLTVGDSPVTIHCNGERVLRSIEHTSSNEDEMQRLRREGRIDPYEETKPSNSFKLLDYTTLVAVPAFYVLAGPCELAMTQSIGHIAYLYSTGKVLDESGVFGLAPYKATMVFEDTDVLNIKGYSDGVSDVVADYLDLDSEFLKTANATQTAKFAKFRWERKWDVVSKNLYDKAIAEGFTLADLPKSQFSFGKGADDVCCVSWIQSKKTA